MKANVIHGDFNPCGGAERLSLVTMQALSEMGINFDLTTLKTPDTSKLENSFGKNLVSVMKSVHKVNVVNIIEEIQKQRDHKDYNYDITINTNGDAAPYYHSSFSKDNAITYCHFPSTKYHIESENTDYLKTDLGMTEWSNDFSDTKNYEGFNNPKSCRTELQFTGKKECLDTEIFRNLALIANGDNKRNDLILVISRIAPHKKIENAIKLAKILKDRKIGTGMKIVGNLYYYYFDYYSYLKQMVIDFGLTDYVTIEVNASLDNLHSIMKKSNILFHPMIGEHFGIAVLEAMAAGLIPVVPSEGGLTEFVPREYQFNSLEEAAKIISSAFHLPYTQRVQISNGVNKFSNSHYIKGFQSIVNGLLSTSHV